MSKIGKKPIIIPDGVSVNLEKEGVSVAGPKGSLELKFPRDVKVTLEDKEIRVTAGPEAYDTRFLGTTRTNIANMITGVTTGWTKTLELSGTGFRGSVTDGSLVLSLGFSHPVKLTAPAGISYTVKENKITVAGADKVKVGEIAAKIRKLRPADPYKAKGFKYENEVIIRKAGKAAKAGGLGAK